MEEQEKKLLNELKTLSKTPDTHDYKFCIDCGRTLSITYEKERCPACEELLLFDKVREYVRKHDVNEYELAEHFELPITVIKQWIKEGRMEYKEQGAKSMTSMYCSRCGAPVTFGTLCPKCLKALNGEKRAGYSMEKLLDEDGRMRFMDK